MSGEFPYDVIAAAQASQRKWGVPAAVTLAQWAIESAYGHAMPAGSNNPFGIKARVGDPYVVAMTREVLHGQSVRIPQNFRVFGSLTEAFNAHGELLATSHFYAHAMLHRDNPDAFADALTGIYATDPHYGAALKSIMRSANLYRYDVYGVAAAPAKPEPLPVSVSVSIPVPVPAQPSEPTWLARLEAFVARLEAAAGIMQGGKPEPMQQGAGPGFPQT